MALPIFSTRATFPVARTACGLAGWRTWCGLVA